MDRARIWDNKLKKWVEGCLLQDVRGCWYDLESLNADSLIFSMYTQTEENSTRYETSDNIWIQDDGGLPIYCGDVVSVKGIQNIVGVVFYDPNNFGYSIRTNTGDVHILFWLQAETLDELSIVVLGNIYENPELIKTDEELVRDLYDEINKGEDVFEEFMELLFKINKPVKDIFNTEDPQQEDNSSD